MSKKIPYKNIKYFTFSENKDFKLENGTSFGPITVAYETFGNLNSDMSNAILIIHALTGDTHVTSDYDEDDKTPGWWDTFVGKKKTVDTEKYFVICANVFGGCMGTTGPSSINPETGKPYGKSFPLITIKDMVNIQKKLIDHLQIKKLKAIIGGSLGGMSVIEWMISYPDMSESFIVIAAAYKTSPQIIAFYEVGRNAILSDPNYNDGDYYDKQKPDRGLQIARMVAHITYLSNNILEKKFGRSIQDDFEKVVNTYSKFGPIFAIESYLRYQGQKFVERFDANSYLYLTKAMDIYDATQNDRYTLEELFKNLNSKILVISFTSDWHFSPEDSWEIVKPLLNLGKHITYLNLQSHYGHDAFLLKNEEQELVVKSFLDSLDNIEINGENK